MVACNEQESRQLLKTVAKAKANVEKSNKEFAKLSNKGKRLAIAKDVLKHIKSEELQVARGVYVMGDLSVSDDINLTKETEAQTVIDEIQKDCKVCALGACMLSYVRLFDNVPLEKMTYNSQFEQFEEPNVETDPIHDLEINIGGDEIREYLSEFFDESQLDLIETAFEASSGMLDYTTLSTYERNIAKAFGDKYPDSTKRLKAIMKNIVDNDTVFKPKKAFTSKQLADIKRNGYDVLNIDFDVDEFDDNDN